MKLIRHDHAATEETQIMDCDRFRGGNGHLQKLCHGLSEQQESVGAAGCCCKGSNYTQHVEVSH